MRLVSLKLGPSAVLPSTGKLLCKNQFPNEMMKVNFLKLNNSGYFRHDVDELLHLCRLVEVKCIHKQISVT
jgi:hypothetical protein